MELRQDSCIRGYHVYNEIWTAVLGEVLITENVFTISHVTINNGALNTVDFNTTMYYLTRLLIPHDKNTVYSIRVLNLQ